MIRLLIFLLTLTLAFPIQTEAVPLKALIDIDTYLTENPDFADKRPVVPEPDFSPEEQRQIEEFQRWARENPEEFLSMGGEEEDPEEQEEAEEQSVDEDLVDQMSCPTDNEDAYFVNAAWKKNKGKNKGRNKGNKSKGKKKDKNKGKKKATRRTPERQKCTAALLKTNVQYCCLLFVRTNLGLPPNLKSAHAKDYGPVLLEHGYCQMPAATTPESAPIGAVIIYTGGESGHIEKKIAEGKFYFGPTFDMPASSWKTKPRKLKAVYSSNPADCKGRPKARASEKARP